MAYGFGPDASEWAARLPRELPLVAANGSRASAALGFALELKRTQAHIGAALFLPELRALIATSSAAKILEQSAASDERDVFFEGLANETLVKDGIAQRNWIRFDNATLDAGRSFVAGCDLWIARSTAETQRVAALIGSLPDSVVLAAPRDPAVPAPRAPRTAGGESIVVWAPRATRDACALIAFGLDSLRVPIEIVCDGGGEPLPHLRARFHPIERAGPLLGDAAAIVDASFHDPGTAIGLAEYGVPLVTAQTSGAHEWLRPVYTYAPWNARAVFSAAATALGGRAPTLARGDDGIADIERERRAADAALLTHGPLVSIVLPTYNRRDWLPDALRSASNQRYRNIEIVVINDAGENIADIVARFPHARLIENARNLGVTGSVNAGIAAARGEYLCFLADDDNLLPDHVARLVTCLERSGLEAAHSKEVTCHYEIGPNRVPRLSGFNVSPLAPTFRRDMLVHNRIGGPGMMVRRRLFEAAGTFDAGAKHGSDFEMWMRLCERADFGFVNHATACVSIRDDTSQLSSVTSAETADLMEYIYSRHPVADGSPTDTKRREAVAAMRARDRSHGSPSARLNAEDLLELQSC